MLADVYDNVGVDFFRPIARGLLAVMPPRPDEQWLDIGCGRGAVLFPAAEAIGPGGRAAGIDISPEMIRKCEDYARESGYANVELRVDDAEDPRFEGRQFDTISSCLVLFFLGDPSGALRRWLPLLRPGGRLGVTTFGPEDPRFASIDEVFEPYLPADMRDARTSGRKGPFATDAGMEALVLDAGFADVRTVTGSVPVRFANVEQWHAFSWSTGQRRMWLSVPEDARPKVRAEAERRLAAFAVPDGSILFEQRVRHTLAIRPR
jgi:SAM-dependent methyltransferase